MCAPSRLCPLCLQRPLAVLTTRTDQEAREAMFSVMHDVALALESALSDFVPTVDDGGGAGAVVVVVEVPLVEATGWELDSDSEDSASRCQCQWEGFTGT
jgi:hypothetical protein